MEIPTAGNRRILMAQFVKYIAARTYKPLLVRYLSRTRTYTYQGLRLMVPPQVFHPGFFTSTRILLRFLSGEELNGKSFLELGAGSGLISMIAARKGARVVSTDINEIAIHCMEQNSQANSCRMKIIYSDLFDQLEEQPFDIIVINPPYYKKNPVTALDHAWYCGENGEYFQRLFRDISRYMHARSLVLMVLCDGCDLQMIFSEAGANALQMHRVFSNRNLLEENYIFRITLEK